MLISVLHGEYSDTRELAVVQLVVLGEKAIPPLTAYLKKEDEIEAGLELKGSLQGEALRMAGSIQE